MASWVRVPFGTPFQNSGVVPGGFPAIGPVAWSHQDGMRWLLNAGTRWTDDTLPLDDDCWVLVDSTNLFPSLQITIDGTTLKFSHSGQFAYGYPLFYAPGGWMLFRGIDEWTIAKSLTPVTYVDRADGPLGNDYYLLESSSASNKTLRFTGHGPHAAGAIITGTWVWPRLCLAGASGEPPCGIYSAAKDGWAGATPGIAGNRAFSGNGAGYMNNDATVCGAARFSQIVNAWIIGEQSSAGVWWTCPDNLAEADTIGQTVTFSAQRGADYKGETPPSITWTFEGFFIPGTKKSIWAVDVARWL